jgi:hypothetical protein
VVAGDVILWMVAVDGILCIVIAYDCLLVVAVDGIL